MFDRQTIINAFAKNRRPADEALTECDCEECQAEVQNLKGKTWSQITLADIGPFSGNINDLTPAAFYYFLPGLLLLTLDHPDADWIAEAVIFRLTESDREGNHVSSRLRQDLIRLNPYQREVLAELVSDWQRHFNFSMFPGIWESLILSLSSREPVRYSWEALEAYNRELLKE
ncbi:MAG: DUF6714 family protein [Planctomycetales bacterium]